MKQYKIILLDVDGTLLDFDKAEEQGIGFLLRIYGVPETEENKEAYHKLNQSYWRRLERGELTRDQVLCLRFEEFFGGFGLSVDGEETDRLYRQSGSTWLKGLASSAMISTPSYLAFPVYMLYEISPLTRWPPYSPTTVYFCLETRPRYRVGPPKT